MFLTLLSASFGYIDIAIIVLLALFLIIGIIRGISKSLKGFLLSIPIILVSIFLVGVTYGPAKTFEPFVMMKDALDTASASWGPSFNSPVMKDEDSGQLLLIIDGVPTDFAEADGAVKGNIARFLANKFITEENTTVAGVAVDKLTNLLIMIILFVAFCIAFGIVFALIRRITEKMHFSENGVVKAIDRILGGLFSAAMIMLFICVILAIINAIPAAQPAQDFINQNIIGSFLLEKNPISMMFNNIFVEF